jgi:AcrR family transcriptional regulator
MNRFESKYFNTALLFDDALLLLLQKKDFDFITVKDVCEKAGVNRSTFYLHYDNTGDLLNECIENINKKFTESFNHNLKEKINSNNLNDLILVCDDYLVPYLNFVKENKLVFKSYYNHPELFKAKHSYDFLAKNIFNPILNKFGFDEKDNEYIISYYINGIMSIVIKWIENDCKEDIKKIIEIIMQCVRPYLDNKK